jgi:hypothetical protein
MPRHNKVKINWANGQTGGKNRIRTFILIAFISFWPVEYFPESRVDRG